MNKQYTLTTSTRPARPRSAKQTDSATPAAAPAIAPVATIGSAATADTHTHANKTDLDRIGTDAEGYVYVRRLVEEVDPDTGLVTPREVVERVRAGWADKAETAALAELARNLSDDSPVRNEFLSKLQPDNARGHITFEQGLTATETAKLLKGAQFGQLPLYSVDAEGNAHLRNVKIDESLHVPELKYNRTTIILGYQLQSAAAGVMERTEEVGGGVWRAYPKLEEGELTSVETGDLLTGIYHATAEQGGATADTDDGRLGLTFAGFATVYFEVTGVDAERKFFLYRLREGTTMHPQPHMTFAARGNRVKPERQAFALYARNYTRYLRGVNDWEIRPANIVLQLGELDNLHRAGLHEDLRGVGLFADNVFLTGKLLVNNRYKPVDEALDEITQQIADSYIYYQYSSDGIEWHDEVRASDRYMRQRKGENGEWGAAMAFGRDGKSEYFHRKYSNDGGKSFTGSTTDFDAVPLIGRNLIQRMNETKGNLYPRDVDKQVVAYINYWVYLHKRVKIEGATALTYTHVKSSAAGSRVVIYTYRADGTFLQNIDIRPTEGQVVTRKLTAGAYWLAYTRLNPEDVGMLEVGEVATAYKRAPEDVEFGTLAGAYMGTVTTSDPLPPLDPSTYSWAQILGASDRSFFRYSDDEGKTFTAADNYTPPKDMAGVNLIAKIKEIAERVLQYLAPTPATLWVASPPIPVGNATRVTYTHHRTDTTPERPWQMACGVHLVFYDAQGAYLNYREIIWRTQADIKLKASYVFDVPAGAVTMRYSRPSKANLCKLEWGETPTPFAVAPEDLVFGTKRGKWLGWAQSVEDFPPLDPKAYQWNRIEGEDGKDGRDGKDGQSVAYVRMTSSNGDTFRNSVIDTQITATQMYGHHDLTPYIPERGYTWTRISRQPELDTVWNERHRNHGRTIRVTAEDVYLRAVFECEPDTSGITDEILAKIISTPQ